MSSSQTFTSTGTWTAPAGVFAVQAECWGGGGSGAAWASQANGGASGGGGGSYAKKNSVTVVPLTVYTVTVGVGGTVVTVGNNGVAGGDSWFSTSGTVLAKGGAAGVYQTTAQPLTGALGGQSSSCIGDTKNSGGNAGSLTTNAFNCSSGGGGAGSTGVGGNATNNANTGGSAGTGTSTNGGNGGLGNSGAGSPSAGSNYAGGGGGGNNVSSAAGAPGLVILTWNLFQTIVLETEAAQDTTVNNKIYISSVVDHEGTSDAVKTSTNRFQNRPKSSNAWTNKQKSQ